MTFGRVGLIPVGTSSHLPSWQWNPNSTEGSMYSGKLIRIDQIQGRTHKSTILLLDEQNLSQYFLFMSPTHLVTAMRPIDNQLVCTIRKVKAAMNLQYTRLWGQNFFVNMNTYVGMHTIQNINSKAARFKMKTVLVCQYSSNLNLKVRMLKELLTKPKPLKILIYTCAFKLNLLNCEWISQITLS